MFSGNVKGCVFISVNSVFHCWTAVYVHARPLGEKRKYLVLSIDDADSRITYSGQRSNHIFSSASSGNRLLVIAFAAELTAFLAGQSELQSVERKRVDLEIRRAVSVPTSQTEQWACSAADLFLLVVENKIINSRLEAKHGEGCVWLVISNVG